MNTQATTPADLIVPGQAEVQRLLETAVIEQGYPGAITEIRNGTQQWFGSAGVADTATGRPRTPQEQFRVGSITKTFTATLVLQLAAEYRLSLDDAVEKWLPGLVQGNGHDGGKITIRQLLNHTSGIFAYTLDEGMLGRYWTPKLLEHRFDKLTPEDLVKIAVSSPADFQPGQDWGYSNTNFVLAAMIIEKAAGMSYADAVAYRITRPLKLTGTYAPGEETGFRGPHTSSYSKLMLPDADAPAHDVTELSPSYAFGVGEIVSTASDLNTFLGALLGGRLLPPAQQSEMFTMTPVPDGKWLDGYSYGLGISSVTLPCGTTVYGHGGMITGTWSYLYGTRDGKRVVTQNVNGDWGMPPVGLFIDVLDAAFRPAA
ncbi:serine hydrolase domain-containing protein [Streptosporangium sp. NBC_01756]|uniref:serine hydrolase domain-containing protein n=1 Tax=Streptosporangium sp. NBC_01756 TaxID=2975950 RepID=UPI002DDAF37F|nr:serine hydrolase domain-containing protein [Streptosporangium sp. NBC_01756]WSC86579.1 beta-lactamase family protein [Streptosporangium sp. NBC_01756]